jgi:alpha-beta hydrolase superfamily lysophospholipase
LIETEHSKRRNEHRSSQQKRRHRLEESLHAEPEIQSDAAVNPRYDQNNDVNGVNLTFRVWGEGPPLVLVMGYRLNSGAWPAAFIEALAGRFSVITLDNRGTGQSDKPVDGYAIANMARDVAGLLDQLRISQAYVLGYSMGAPLRRN